MAPPGTTKSRRPAPAKNDLNEARPLLRAIFLGMVLAGGLMAAAAMATPQGQQTPQVSPPSTGQQLQPSADTSRPD
ncbi:hypothetical protein [uncultured Roseibium sp.]|uniref:hypothetical protein n=1 Tax=uncultured Roseibium sp. TaxID=1936171 RepID=UPI0026144D3F|nr:hypothetical protein [uncultured Roseibium sp.]